MVIIIKSTLSNKMRSTMYRTVMLQGIYMYIQSGAVSTIHFVIVKRLS